MARPKNGSHLSITQLEELLRDRRKSITDLERERDKARRRLDELNQQLAAIGGGGHVGAGGGRTGTRPRNEKSLNVVLFDVLSAHGGPMKVADITEAVRAQGYRSTSANFRGIVNQTLIKDKRFTSPYRGAYQLKKGPDKGEKDKG